MAASLYKRGLALVFAVLTAAGPVSAGEIIQAALPEAPLALSAPVAPLLETGMPVSFTPGEAVSAAQAEPEGPAPDIPAPGAEPARPIERAEREIGKRLHDPFSQADLPEPVETGAPRVYFLSRPIETRVALGPVSRAAHYGGEVAIQLGKAAVLYHFTGKVWAAAALFVSALVFHSPVGIVAQSMADLKLRGLYRRLKALRPFGAVPGATRLSILQTSSTGFRGLIAAEQESRGFVFVQTPRALEREALPEALGKAVAIGDPASTRLKLELSFDGRKSRFSWSPTLAEVYAGAAVPEAVLRAWRKEFNYLGRIRRALKRRSVLAGLRLEASLVFAQGREFSFGAIGEGASVEKTLGLTSVARLTRWLKIKVLRRSAGVPLAKVDVVREIPSSLGARLALAWRRLVGRAVLAQPKGP